MLYVTSFVVSVGAIIQRNHVTIGLAILNWVLILNTIVTVVFGSNLWFMTLKEEANFGNVWNTTTAERRIGVQDQLQCCGFANNTSIEVGGFCADPSKAVNNGCDVKFTVVADTMLMDAFTYALFICAPTCSLKLTLGTVPSIALLEFWSCFSWPLCV